MARKPDSQERARRLVLVRESVSRLSTALPPNAVEAECALLGSIILEPRCLGDVLQIVRSPEDFYKPAHQVVYAALLALHEIQPQVELVALQQLLLDKGQLEGIGGLQFLLELAEAVPSAVNAQEYARAVRDKAVLRRLIDASAETIDDAFSRSHDANSVLEEAESKIFAIAQSREHTQASDLQTLLHETMTMIENADGRAMGGVPSGFDDLDTILNGLHRGEVIILAARPSMGKTALALNMMEHVSLAGTPCAIFSLEMGRQQLAQRMLCARSGVDSQRVRKGQLRREDNTALQAACDQLSRSKIWVDDTPGMTLLQMRSKARRLCDQHQIGAVFIDYLQLMSTGARTESRQVEVSEISRGIKAMARELNVPVVCLSQLNRAVEGRTGNRPRISDLRESGSIEQDADVVMMLHREDYYHAGEEQWAQENAAKVGTAELIIAKQRNGPTGTVSLVWDRSTTAFRSYAARSMAEGVEYRRSDSAVHAAMDSYDLPT
ncbi:MAG: replicative DNA helicase [Planctomycetota bacterium]|nr:replicative DNA helicase [Planctomycetota bacterium]